MPSGSRETMPVGVDRLQPGDHACLAFSDDGERWEVLGDFARYGFARGEKVYLSVSAADGLDAVAALAAGGMAAARSALASGQLVVSRAPRFRPGLDPETLVMRSLRRLDDAVAEGFSGVRAASELPVAPDVMADVVEFEKALHRAVTAPHDGARYTALCHWDERAARDRGPAREPAGHPGQGTGRDAGQGTGQGTGQGGRPAGAPDMDAIRALHPVTVIARPGTLHACWTAGGVRLTGDSDLSTRGEFTAIMRALADLRPPGDEAGQPVVLDISDLSFLDAHSAGMIVRMAAALDPGRRLEVRCRAHHRRLLQMLGARALRQLSLVTSRLA